MHLFICSHIPPKKSTVTLPSLGWFTGPCCSGALWNGVREDFEFQDQFPLKWRNKSKDPNKWLKISQNIFHCFSCFCAETDFHLRLCAKQKTWWYCTCQDAAGTFMKLSWTWWEMGVLPVLTRLWTWCRNFLSNDSQINIILFKSFSSLFWWSRSFQ